MNKRELRELRLKIIWSTIFAAVVLTFEAFCLSYLLTIIFRIYIPVEISIGLIWLVQHLLDRPAIRL